MTRRNVTIIQSNRCKTAKPPSSELVCHSPKAGARE
jgi:hypothetical protein